MSSPRVRILAAALAAAIPLAAWAQLSVRVNWVTVDGTPKVCVITADQQGVSMDGENGLVLNGVFGGDCPGGTVTPPQAPVITNDLDANELPSTSAAGAVHTVNWSADADRCTYASSSFPAAVSGWPTSGDVCSSAASCALPHPVAVTLPGTPGSYAFNLSCYRNGVTAPAVSQRTVVVPGAPSGCLAPVGVTRAETAYVEFNYTPGAGRTVDDAKLFENIFGYYDAATPIRLFPGVGNVNQRVFLAPDFYLALRFTVPQNLNIGAAGQLRFEETQPQADVQSLTISKSCGDFNPVPAPGLLPGCVVTDMTPNGNLAWVVGMTVPGFCRLERGETYYLNIIHASLTTPTLSECASGTCGNTIQNQKAPGSAAWPL